MSVAETGRKAFTDLTLRTLVDLRRLQQMQDEFAAEHGLALIAVDPRGNPITTASRFTPFCQLMRQDPVLRQACFNCDAHGGLQAAIDSRPYIYRCHTGLIDMSAPIMYNGIYLGALLCGQVQVADLELAPISPQLSAWQTDRERLRRFEAIPIMDESDLQRTAAALYALTDALASGAGQRVEDMTETPVKLFLTSAESWRAPATYDLATLSRSIADGDAAAAMRTIGHYLTHVSTDDQMLVGLASLADFEAAMMDAAGQVSTTIHAQIRLLVQREHRGKSRQKHLSRFDAQMYAESLAWPILDEMESARASQGRTLTDLLNVIERDLGAPPPLTAAAQYLSLSQSHFSKVFKAATGMTYVAYVTEKRIERAKLFLAHTDIPITRIATELGFQPANYFTRTFKKHTGKPPSEFRRHRSHTKGFE